MQDKPQREIELNREAFRPVHEGPLANPRETKQAMLIAGICTIVAALAAWRLGTWWSAFLPVFPAMYIGIGWAGLEPGYWFRNPPRT